MRHGAKRGSSEGVQGLRIEGEGFGDLGFRIKVEGSRMPRVVGSGLKIPGYNKNLGHKVEGVSRVLTMDLQYLIPEFYIFQLCLGVLVTEMYFYLGNYNVITLNATFKV